jgi:hypothetical protein
VAPRVWSTNFVTISPGSGAPTFYTCPDNYTMVLKNMTFTFGGTGNGHGQVLTVDFGLPSCVVWTLGSANVQNRTYQWEGRETWQQSGEGPFLPTLNVTTIDGYSSFTANGFLLSS